MNEEIAPNNVMLTDDALVLLEEMIQVLLRRAGKRKK